MKNLNFKLNDIEMKLKSVIKNKKKILVSYSGGKDSDTLLFLLKKFNVLHLCDIVFFNTGIEWRAQLKHIDEKINSGIKINKIMAFKPVPLVVKNYGSPIISKYVSDMLERLQKHNFDFKNDGLKKYSELIKKYPKCLGGLRWWCNYYGSEFDTNLKNKKDYGGTSKSAHNISRNKYLKEFILSNGLNFKVSCKCCHYSKKMTSKKYEKKNKIDLKMTGVRKSEGGIRSKKYISCYIENKKMYMPLFWFSDSEINLIIKLYNIKLSDCYTKYNLKRTGCAGCPFGRGLNFEREQLKKYEINLSKGIENLFKYSYEFTDKYKKFVSEKNEN